MRRVLLLIALVAMVGSCRWNAAAQDPTITLPKNYRKVLDNPDVTVLRVHYGPHEQVPVHDHPAYPTIYVYLDDCGPVRFVHEPENVILTRPPTHTGSYRVSPGRRERHSLVNLSDKPTDYLRVELKKVPLGTLKREFRGSAPQRLEQETKVEFADPALRIERVICDPRGSCLLPEESAPSVLVAFSPSELREGRRRQAFPEQSSTLWLPAGKGASVKAMGASPAQLLRIVLPAR